MTPTDPHVVLIDNRDSFVYNLVDALHGCRTTVFRNTVPVAEVLAAEPDLLVLSPGPGHPRQAGNLMQLVDAAAGRIPLLGICLGFQALLEHHGATVEPCGPVHGASVPMTLTPAGQAHPVFAGLATDVEPDDPTRRGTQIPVARYHSLGCRQAPAALEVLATTAAPLGEVVMAAATRDGRALGLQFHPESILTPAGPLMIQRCISQLSGADPTRKDASAHD